MPLSVELTGGRSSYRPGETVHGTFAWALPKPPNRMELRLFWYTQGKGTQDVTIVQTQQANPAMAAGSQPFEFHLPEGPYTVYGKLISVLWAIELVVDSASDAGRADLVVSPWDEPVTLGDPAASGL